MREGASRVKMMEHRDLGIVENNLNATWKEWLLKAKDNDFVGAGTESHPVSTSRPIPVVAVTAEKKAFRRSRDQSRPQRHHRMFGADTKIEVEVEL